MQQSVSEAMIPYSAEPFLEVLAVYNQTVLAGPIDGAVPLGVSAGIVAVSAQGQQPGHVWLSGSRLAVDRPHLHGLAPRSAQLGGAVFWHRIRHPGITVDLVWSDQRSAALSRRQKRSFLGGSVSSCLCIDYLPIGRAARSWSRIGSVGGLAPTPLTILTMGVLLLCRDRTPVHLLVIPVVWSSALPERCYGRGTLASGGTFRCRSPASQLFSSPSPGRVVLKDPAIRDRDYRRLFAGAAFHQQGMAGEQVVLGLLVIQLMGSSAWVGYTLAAYFTPFFVFGLVSGAITDWTDKADAASPDRDRHRRHARRLRNHARTRHRVHLANPRLQRLCRQPACHAPSRFEPATPTTWSAKTISSPRWVC